MEIVKIIAKNGKARPKNTSTWYEVIIGVTIALTITLFIAL